MHISVPTLLVHRPAAYKLLPLRCHRSTCYPAQGRIGGGGQPLVDGDQSLLGDGGGRARSGRKLLSGQPPLNLSPDGHGPQDDGSYSKA